MNNRILGIIVAYGILAAASATLSSSFQIIVSNAFSDPGSGSRAEKAPIIVSGGGNNIYVV